MMMLGLKLFTVNVYECLVAVVVAFMSASSRHNLRKRFRAGRRLPPAMFWGQCALSPTLMIMIFDLQQNNKCNEYIMCIKFILTV
jgi:hypothetical protein